MSQIEIGTLWNGGWDNYLVDTDVVINDPFKPDENPWPTFEQDGETFVRSLFSGKLSKNYPGKAVKVIQWLAGGD